jgi:hypothetical protein
MIMLMSVFAIYDAGISTWMPPIFVRNKGEILRWFMDCVNDPQSKLSKYPSDYTLFEVGSWDDDKCKFDLLKTPVSIGIAIEYVKAKTVDLENAKVSEIGQLGSGGR